MTTPVIRVSERLTIGVRHTQAMVDQAEPWVTEAVSHLESYLGTGVPRAMSVRRSMIKQMLESESMRPEIEARESTVSDTDTASRDKAGTGESSVDLL